MPRQIPAPPPIPEEPPSTPGRVAERHVPALLLVLLVACNAAGAMIVEIVAGRLLAPYFGMSLYTWTTVIGVVLTGLAIGHWAGGRLADAYPERRLAMLGLACLVGAVSTVLVLPVTAIVGGSLSVAGTPLATAIVLTGFAAFLLPSLTAGLVQPIATTYALEALGSGAGLVVGRMLAAGVVGAILGTFLAGFVLIGHLGSAGSIWLVAALNGLLGALLLAAPRPRAVGALLFLIGSTFALTGTTPPGFGVPCQHESDYYCISIFPGDVRGLPEARMMRIDSLMHGVNSPDPGYFAFSHLQWVDELAWRRFGEQTFASFFIGGGAYTLPRAWIARNPRNAVTVAEIDPLVTRLAEKHLWFDPGPATTVLDQDARTALLRDLEGERFDVIVGDAFRDIAMPAHLVTDAFHAQLRRHLAPDGFYVLNVIDEVASRDLVQSIVHTLRQRFSTVEIWYETAEVQTAVFANFILYAAARPSGLPSPLEARHEPERRWTRALNEGPWPGAILLTDDYAPVERLLSRY